MPQARIERPLVLVVEDDLLVRMHAVDIVEEAGFAAVEAGNAQEAIEILNARIDIRIVFTDVHMPGSLDGLKLALAIRERWPPIELIITSGLTSPANTDIPTRGKFIAKPYLPAQLVAALRSFNTGAAQ